MKKILLLLFLASRLVSANNADNHGELDTAARVLFDKAQTLLVETRDAAQALAVLDEADALYQKRIAHEKRRIYATSNQTESLAYLLESANNKEDAVVIDGIWADLLYLRGYAYLERGDAEAGKRAYDRVLAIAPAHVMARNGRGNYHLLKKDWDSAQADFEYVIANNLLDNEDAQKLTTAAAKRGLGYILIERGAWDEAEALYKQLLADNPGDAKAQNQLQYIREQRDGERQPPSFLVHAAEYPAGEHTSAWANAIRPDVSRAKTAEEYARLANEAMRDHAADMRPALRQDCVTIYGDAHAAACTCATDKADYRAYFELKIRAAQGIAEHYNHEFAAQHNQFRAIEKACQLPPMPQ
ncbi:MAG: tetratricopeptide repeat protein [Cardiobacteriaceae bacterium]|nr:tetratricopeptide repeat protein [Cardiobacteriaceae bacterium]